MVAHSLVIDTAPEHVTGDSSVLETALKYANVTPTHAHVSMLTPLSCSCNAPSYKTQMHRCTGTHV